MDIRHAVGVKMGVPAEKLADVLTFQASSRFSERERAALGNILPRQRSWS